ncbi:unnamed protein product [Prunus armeniaca]|uniref:Uncharacterized protein n=1 Tax=Prunus armeniaca TaxID=36596 RepID=A0A6J5VEE0_PRUAR|nr:unnamed protein product [Prunus armeniaca]
MPEIPLAAGFLVPACIHGAEKETSELDMYIFVGWTRILKGGGFGLNRGGTRGKCRRIPIKADIVSFSFPVVINQGFRVSGNQAVYKGSISSHQEDSPSSVSAARYHYGVDAASKKVKGTIKLAPTEANSLVQKLMEVILVYEGAPLFLTKTKPLVADPPRDLWSLDSFSQLVERKLSSRKIYESSYILDDKEYVLKYKTELRGAVLRAKASPQGLLKGYDVYIAAHVQPTARMLSCIVRSAGGNFLEEATK